MVYLDELAIQKMAPCMGSEAVFRNVIPASYCLPDGSEVGGAGG
jgi:hypothetical protein